MPNLLGRVAEYWNMALQKVVDYAREHNILVIHDFAYADLTFDGYQAPSIMQAKGAKEVAVEFFSLSKSYSMAGWRAGFCVGNQEAAVELIQFVSYTCPHCATFHARAFKQLKEEYIDTGRINFVYREVYFDRFGLWAEMIARCAGEERTLFSPAGWCPGNR